MAVAPPSRSRSRTPEAPAPAHELRCAHALTPAELAAHHAIRQQVFVEEQALFAVSDRDDHDGAAATLAVLGWCDGAAAGAVRLYPLDDQGLWLGDRLAVLAPHRAHGLGAPLVRFAVATAGALGGHTMLAHIQVPNVAFFEHLGWQRVGPVEPYVGVPHQTMRIALGA